MALVSRNGPTRFTASTRSRSSHVGVEQQRQRRRPERAGVVDQDVDGPDQRGGRAGQAVDGLLVADVGGERVGLAARAPGSRGHAAPARPRSRATSTTRAPARGQRPRERRAQPAARPRSSAPPRSADLHDASSSSTRLRAVRANRLATVANALADGYSLGMAQRAGRPPGPQHPPAARGARPDPGADGEARRASRARPGPTSSPARPTRRWPCCTGWPRRCRCRSRS